MCRNRVRKKTADTMSQDVTSDAQSPRTLASLLKLRELELPTKMTVFRTVVASPTFQHVPTAVRKLPLDNATGPPWPMTFGPKP